MLFDFLDICKLFIIKKQSRQRGINEQTEAHICNWYPHSMQQWPRFYSRAMQGVPGEAPQSVHWLYIVCEVACELETLLTECHIVVICASGRYRILWDITCHFVTYVTTLYMRNVAIWNYLIKCATIQIKRWWSEIIWIEMHHELKVDWHFIGIVDRWVDGSRKSSGPSDPDELKLY